MKEEIDAFRHLKLPGSTPWNDTSIIDLYERNFCVKLPPLFTSFLMVASSAVLSALFIHPELEPDDNEFPIWRVVSIGRHRHNEQDDLLVLTEFEHYNRGTIPKKVIAFAFDYHSWPIFLDLTEAGGGRVAVHDNRDRLPRPSWANPDHAYPCAYIAESFDDYVRRLVPDPVPPM
jgi:hypothetical protein